MPLLPDEVQSALALHDPRALRAILVAAKVRVGRDESSEALADRIVRSTWWHASTPLGYAAGSATLEDLVQRVAKRLDVAHRVHASDDGWQQLEQLTRALVRTLPEGPGIALSDIEPGARTRLSPHWKRTVALGGGASGSIGARWTSAAVIGFLEGPVGRLLPLLPPLAPWVRTIRTGAGAVHAVSGPLGVALAVLSLNQALGVSYTKLLPLLLGIGALGG